MEKNIVPTVTHGSGSVMPWVGPFCFHPAFVLENVLADSRAFRITIDS